MSATLAAQTPQFEKLQLVAQSLRDRAARLPAHTAMPLDALARRVEQLTGGGR